MRLVPQLDCDDYFQRLQWWTSLLLMQLLVQYSMVNTMFTFNPFGIQFFFFTFIRVLHAMRFEKVSVSLVIKNTVYDFTYNTTMTFLFHWRMIYTIILSCIIKIQEDYITNCSWYTLNVYVYVYMRIYIAYIPKAYVAYYRPETHGSLVS